MIEFEYQRFWNLLREAPPRQPFTIPGEKSDYVEEHIVNPLNNDEALNLKELDFSAFELSQIPVDYSEEIYQRISGNWAVGLNKRFRRVPAVAAREKRFF